MAHWRRDLTPMHAPCSEIQIRQTVSVSVKAPYTA